MKDEVDYLIKHSDKWYGGNLGVLQGLLYVAKSIVYLADSIKETSNPLKDREGKE